MPRKLSTAILRSASGVSSIDVDAGIIRGIKLMQLGVVARFAGEDGPKSVKTTDAHIQALLNHAGNKAIPIHLTHDWFEEGTDTAEMSARIGSAKNFRRDESGNLIADAHLNKAKPAALDLLWGAESNPEDNCFSVVFSYLKDDPNCIPQNFRAADLVPSGAATTALFSEDQNQNDMPDTDIISQLVEAAKDPHKLAALKALLKSVESASAESEDTAAAEMESDGGVTDADKKKDDDQKPALMRAAVRCERARNRKIEEQKTALLSEMDVKVKASETALLGRGQFLDAATGAKIEEEYTAALSEYTKSAPNKATAIARLLKDKPHLSEAHDNAQRAHVAKLRNAA